MIHILTLNLQATALDSKNIFDNLPALAAPKPSDLRDELECFLSTDPEYVKDVLAWWYEH